MLTKISPKKAFFGEIMAQKQAVIQHLYSVSQYMGTIKTKSGNSIKSVESFIYLGSEINSTEKDFKICILSI